MLRPRMRASMGSQAENSTGRNRQPVKEWISPVLANIFLHYALDLWFEKREITACVQRELRINKFDQKNFRLKRFLRPYANLKEKF